LRSDPGVFDVMRLDGTLGQSHHVALRIRLYVDVNIEEGIKTTR
jgi:hypothetical protein